MRRASDGPARRGAAPAPAERGAGNRFADAEKNSLAVLNGDLDAAQVVARECLLLAQSRCAVARERWEACRQGWSAQRSHAEAIDHEYGPP